MKAIVFGAHGQMGSYLVELLKSKGYFVYAPSKREVDFENLHSWDLTSLFEAERPDEVYNFASVNVAPDSWHMPCRYVMVNGYAVLKLLQVMVHQCPGAKFFQAGSAEMFDKASVHQWEDTNRLPNNPYGLSKMMATEFVRIFREHHGMFACTGIYFNAESPRRPRTFFAEKVAEAVVRLKLDFDAGKWEPIKLGRLDARRDWGWAPEYAEVAWKMLQLEQPLDLVIGTGETHTCWTYVAEALKAAGLPGMDDPKTFDRYVTYDRGSSPNGNCMNAQPWKAKKYLGWEAQYKMKDVVRMLVEAELKVLSETGLIRTTS